MKPFIIAVAGVVALAACSTKRPDSFTVSGNIANAPGKKVYLMEIPYNAPNPVIVDSITLDAKGAFSLKGGSKDERIYSLAIQNGPEVLLVNDESEIDLNLDVSDYRHYTVKGSPASESLHALFEDYSSKDSMLFVAIKNIDSLQKAGAGDSAIAVLQADKTRRSEELNNTIKQFISSSPSAAARFYAIGLGSRTMPARELKPLIDASLVKFKDHEGLASMSRMFSAQAQSRPEYALTNQQAPEIAMPDKNGKVITLSSFKGKYVLVDFWASWCGPCRKENPNVVAAYNKFKNKNFTVLGVSLDQDKTAWMNAVATDKLAWTQISDLKQWESAAVPAYGIEGIPFNVLVDPQGKIIASNLREHLLEEKLTEVLK